MSEEGLRIAQCWFGVEDEGRVKLRSGKRAGLGDAS